MSKKQLSDKDLSSQFFKSNKDLHYNYEEFRGDYKVSTGSKIFDEVTDGGFSSGVVRFVGPTEAGKTAEALEVQSNFLSTIENSKGIYVKAEGRLSKDVRERADLNFVFDPEEWELGTTLVVESNIYEFVFDWLRAIMKNEKKIRYCIIIDSMDGLLPKDALEKGTADAPKVAAGAVMTSDFLRRVNLAMCKRGHLCIMMGQVRAEIRADKYTPKDKNKLGGASGGNAAVHYPEWVIEFQRANVGDMILPKDADISSSNRPIGKMAKVKIWKSTNETTMIPVAYPIKFGRVGRSSIWVEREIVDLLLAWGFFERNGAWYNSDEKLTEFLGGEGKELKVQGVNNLYKALEEDGDLLKKLEEYCDKEILQKV